MPFFSIVIPTRNRPSYLIDAISSILGQSFGDFELIVSDNSDADEAALNQKAINGLKDSRLRYVRPSNTINMTDHWNWALSHASGSYVGVVTDRMALRLYALETIAEVLKETSAAAICYRSHNTRESKGGSRIHVDHAATGYAIIKSIDKLREFSKGLLPKDTPRLLNSFAKREVLDAIVSRHGKLVGGAAPDYSFNFRTLDELENYASLDASLLIVQGEESSNGKALTTGRPNRHSEDFKNRQLKEQAETLQYGIVPNDVNFLLNVILREYCIVSAGKSKKTFPELDHQSIYVNAAKYAIDLSKRDILPEEIREVIETYRNIHQFNPITIPLNRKASTFNRARKALGKKLEDSFLAGIAHKVRSRGDALMVRYGFGRSLSGTKLIDVLQQDLLLHKERNEHPIRRA